MKEMSKPAYQSLSDYQCSVEYQVVCILSAYRVIAGLGGYEFIKRVSTRKEIQDEKNFMILVDAGFVVLDNADILDYAMYICKEFHYNVQIFFDLLFEVAAKYIPSKCTSRNNINIVKAIAEITDRMANINYLQ